jgi:nicotinate-nucleotide adenylyltransferase
LGILGGAFNPPHLGHLICAQQALVELRLDRVVFVPVGEPSHRRLEADPGAEARLAMCERAVGVDERFDVSAAEVDRAGPSYTVDTLRELREGAPDAEPFVILGADQASALPEWHEPEEVLRLASVACAERGGDSRGEVTERLAGLAGAERVVFFSMPRIDVSSTMVRELAAAGHPLRYLVPDAVASYIEEQGLYGTPTAVAAG